MCTSSSIHILLSEVITVFHFGIFPLAERPKCKKSRIELWIFHKPVNRQLILVEYCHCYGCSDCNTLKRDVLRLRTEIPNDVVQGHVGILSNTKPPWHRSESFLVLIDVKLGEVGLCCRRLFRIGGSLSPLLPCVYTTGFVLPLAWERKKFSPSAIATGDLLLFYRIAVE